MKLLYVNDIIDQICWPFFMFDQSLNMEFYEDADTYNLKNHWNKLCTITRATVLFLQSYFPYYI